MQKSVKPTYSIILMRDDCDVSAFRLHSFWIKLFIFFLIILIAVCIAGAYGTFYYKNRYVVSSAERRDLQRSLGESTIKLENLVNEEWVGRLTGTPPSSSNTLAQNLNSVVMPAPSGVSAGGSASSAPTPYTVQTVAAPSQEDLSMLLSQLGPVRAAGLESDAEIEAKMEAHPVKVSNLKTSFEADDRIRTTYDLSNQQQGITLVGRCNIALVTRDGAVVDVTPSARGVLSFQISRFRKMDILAKIPPTIKKDDIVKVQISAQANEFPLYYKQFAVTN